MGIFLDVSFTYIVAEVVVYVGDAVFDIFGGALGEHLNSAILQITNKAGETMTVCNTICRKAKANALHVAIEDYMSGYLVHALPGLFY